jgi:hypothetical protein
MANETAAVAKKRKGPFGVYQLPSGSYTLGEFRFTPFRAIPCDEATKALACEDSSPVKFFDDEAAATDAAGKLKAKADAKKNPQPRED